MADNCFSHERVQFSHLPVEKIGIVFCTSTRSSPGRELEKLADCEVIDVADAVQAALASRGFQVELVDLDPESIGDLRRFDWVFNLAESICGFPLADFEVAQEMEKYNIPFTGSGSSSLKVCLDKAMAKVELMRNGIRTPAYEVFNPGDTILNMLEYPLIVKPIREDGSIGITADSIVTSGDKLEQQVQKVHKIYHQAALVEEFIEGRDITASVIGNGQDTVVLPLSEIIISDHPGPRFLTFNSKWSPETPEYQASRSKCPCYLPVKTTALLKKIALQAYRVMGCRDYARVDFRLRGNIPYVLEVNANPCINPDDSGFVRSSKAAGYSYTEMVMKILEAAVQDRLQVTQGILEEEYV